MGDADYARNRQADGSTGEWGGRGSQALLIMTQVMSVNHRLSTAVVDAGLKAVSLDSGPPVVMSLVVSPGDTTPPGDTMADVAEYKCAGDEHGLLLFPHPGTVPGGVGLPNRGSLAMLQPGHCDPTVNLYDWLVAFRREGGGAGRVEAVWRIAGRGPGS